MLSDRDFLRKSLRIGLISAINSGILGLGGLWISREIGPDSRGMLTKMLLVFVGLGIISEFGVLGTATYFTSVNSTLISPLLKYVRNSMLRKMILLGLPYLFLIQVFRILNIQQILLIGITVLVGNFFSGPTHVLQGLDINLWRKVQSSQSFAYAGLFVILYSLGLNINPNLAFLLVALPGVFSNLVGQHYLKRRKVESAEQGGMITNLEFVRYSRSNFIWILFTEIFNRLDLVLAASVLSMNQLGNFSLVMSWLIISTPFSSAIGNIVFPDIARANSLILFDERKLIFYLRNVAIVSILLTCFLVFVMPYSIDRLMAGVYSGYSEFVLPMAMLVVIKQINSVFGEVARGLNLNFRYGLSLFTSLLCIAVLYEYVDPKSPKGIIAISLFGQGFNFILVFYIIRRHLKNRSSE